jgi:simple sugar transport system permease protein
MVGEMAVDTTPMTDPARIQTGGRHPRAGIVYIVLALLIGTFGVMSIDGATHTTFRLDLTSPDVQWSLPTLGTVVVLAALVAAAGVWMLMGMSNRLYKVASAGAAAVVVLALVIWAVGRPGVVFPLESILAGSLFLSLPFIFGALSGVVCERSGVINIGIEGQFLAGAFTGVLVANIATNPYAGILGAMLAGSLSTLLLALLATKYQVNQVVAGVILNLLALGLTSFLLDAIKTTPGLTSAYRVPSARGAFEAVGLGFLADIPLIGPILFRQNLFVYVGLFVVVLVWFLLFRTRWGLRTRAVGEHPAAADAMGVNVNRLRFWNVAAAGLISGFGGAFFTIAQGLGFSKGMTAGLGFVALAVMIVGRWNPWGVLAGALIFGFATRMAAYLDTMRGGFVVPGEFLQMLPYAVTLIVVAGLIGKARPPAADGVPYNPGDK